MPFRMCTQVLWLLLILGIARTVREMSHIINQDVLVLLDIHPLYQVCSFLLVTHFFKFIYLFIINYSVLLFCKYTCDV